MDLLAFAKFAYVFYLSCQFQWLTTFSKPEQSLKKCSFPAIFNFGDSNSDTGIAAATITNYLFSKNPPGRYSNGRLTIDFMACNLNIPILKPYFNNSDGANYTAGANFAVGGATTLPYPGEKYTYLDEEYQNFVQFVHKSQLISNKGVMPKQEYFSRALYTIDIGQNEIASRLKNFTTIKEINALVPRFVDALVVHVKALYAKGARSFWIHNTGPVGCLPNLHGRNPPLPLDDQKDRVGCILPYNNVALYFNKKLKESVASLRVALPLAAITYVDIYSIKYSLFIQREKYGFSPPDYSSPHSSCDEKCATSILYDSVHYTEAANKVVYDLILTGNFSDPPIAPNLACNH